MDNIIDPDDDPRMDPNDSEFDPDFYRDYILSGISMDECNSFFFMQSGGFLSLMEGMGLAQVDIREETMFDELANRVNQNLPQVEQVIAEHVLRDSFTGRAEMSRAVALGRSIHASYMGSVSELKEMFLGEGVPEDDAEELAITATIETMNDMYMTRDEDLKRSESSDGNPPSAKFSDIFK